MATFTINNTYYMFTVTSANATVGATYTNNGVTYTVRKTVAAGTKLYTTATGGSVTSGSTLTKTAGTGDATITFSTVALKGHINGLNGTPVAGDTVNVAGSELIIDETPSFNLGPLTANNSTTIGKITISNPSATTPIVLTFNTQNSDFTGAYPPNIVSMQGEWIQIGTGTGLAGQTLDFNTCVGGVAIDYPSVVWVETGDSRHKLLTVAGVSNYYMPFFNVNAVTDVQAINMLTEFHGDLNHGPVFQYNTTTKIATFGSGGATTSSLGGAVIPNGAKILYTSIHVTSSVYDSTFANRNMMVFTAGATLTMDKVSFSRNWNLGANLSNVGDLTISNVGCTAKFVVSAGIGTTSINNLAVAPDTNAALSGSLLLQIGACLGEQYLDYLWALGKTNTTYAPIIQVNNTTQLKALGTVWSWGSNTTTGAFPFVFDTCINGADAPIVAGPLYGVGGPFTLYRVDNFHITEMHHGARCDAINSTTIGEGVVSTSFAKNSTIAKIRKLSASAASVRNVVATFDAASVQCCVKDIVYNGQSNTASAISIAGQEIYATNITLDNTRSTLITNTSGTKNNRIADVDSSTMISGTNLPNGGFLEWIMNSSASGYTGTVVYDGQPFQPAWTNTAKTTAKLFIGSLSLSKNTSIMTVVSGVKDVDWWVLANGVYAPNSGVELIWTNEWPIRGITNFTASVATFTHTAFTTNATMEFSMRVNDGTDTSTWTAWADATTAANWQTALASLTGYNSTKGFFARFRLKTTGASASRVFNYGNVTCTPDSAWVSEEQGFVPITVSGQVNNSTIKLYDYTIPASPVGIKTQTLTTDATILRFPYNFDATAKAFRLKLRKAGYGEVVTTDSTYQRGKSVPFSQVLYTSINDAVVSLYTGISVNGATNTVTLTSDHTMLEIYSYCQWWAAQVANMEYNIPYVTTDNINYTSTYNLVMNGGSITGTGTLNLGAATLTRAGSESSTLPITYNSGAANLVNITVTGLVANSRVYINNTTDNVSLYNAVVASTSLSTPVVWTANKNLNVRVTYCVGTTAYLPFELTGTLTTSGASFAVTQSLDTVYNTNSIDGSTITEYVTDYPNVQIDLSGAGTSTTPQRAYAWYVNNIYSSTGIVNYFGGLTATDLVNYRINADIMNLLFDNTSGHNIQMNGGYIYRSDGANWIYSGSANSIIPFYDRAYVANSDFINANTSLIPVLLAKRY